MTDEKHVHDHTCNHDHDHDHSHNPEDMAKAQEEFQNKISELSKVSDFKEYYKVQRDIIKNYVGTWGYVDQFLETDPLAQYKLLLESFGKKAELDKEQGKVDKKKQETVEKFSREITEHFEKKDFEKTSQQLFYVLLGNLLEHIGKADTDMKSFDIEKDLYPAIKTPALSITFFLFQNMTFGPIREKVNALSEEYLKKYTALFMGLWRTTFEVMSYEKQMEAAKQQQDADEKKEEKKDDK